MAVTDTGTSDQTYDLISVIYHALNGAETYEQYLVDAERDDEVALADFMRSAHDRLREIADEGKQLLAGRISPSERTGGRGRRAPSARSNRTGRSTR